MLINNVDISKFNAKQLTVDIQPSTIMLEKEWIKNSLNPKYLSSSISFKKLKVTLYFKGNNRDEILHNISNVLSLIRQESILNLDGYKNNYVSFLINHNTEKTIRKNRYKLNLEFDSYEITNLIEESLNKIYSKDITVVGNTSTPAIVEITPILDIIDITLQGLTDDPIKIKNLSKDKTVVINGEAGLITENGVNKFDDTDMWEFPRLHVGTNNIKLSRNDCNIKIKYKARWI